jgi:hypothetical protein
MLGLRLCAGVLHLEEAEGWVVSWCGPISGMADRAEVASELRRRPGQDLVIVRYGPKHDLSNEWVFNAADIDRAPVVWAHDMGPLENRELIEYYRRRRRIWLLEENGVAYHKLSPYPEAEVARANGADPHH